MVSQNTSSLLERHPAWCDACANASIYAVAGFAILVVAIVLMFTDPVAADGAMPAIPFMLAMLGFVVFLGGIFGVMLLLHAQALIESTSPATTTVDSPVEQQ